MLYESVEGDSEDLTKDDRGTKIANATNMVVNTSNILRFDFTGANIQFFEETK